MLSGMTAATLLCRPAEVMPQRVSVVETTVVFATRNLASWTELIRVFKSVALASVAAWGCSMPNTITAPEKTGLSRTLRNSHEDAKKSAPASVSTMVPLFCNSLFLECICLHVSAIGFRFGSAHQQTVFYFLLSNWGCIIVGFGLHGHGVLQGLHNMGNFSHFTMVALAFGCTLSASIMHGYGYTYGMCSYFLVHAYFSTP